MWLVGSLPGRLILRKIDIAMTAIPTSRKISCRLRNGLHAKTGPCRQYQHGSHWRRTWSLSGAAQQGSMTCKELARETGVHDRYLREWLSHQAASNYLSY